jgi:hypothetical protein
VSISDEDIDAGKCPEAKDSKGNTLFLACCFDVLRNEVSQLLSLQSILDFR